MIVRVSPQEHIWAGIRGNRGVLAEKIKDLSASPGVYVFRDESGEVLYVGTVSYTHLRESGTRGRLWGP